MLINYIKIAWRNLWKNKLFSFINIMGLGLALPFALLSLLQLQSAFEFDNFHPDPQLIYRVITEEQPTNGKAQHFASSPFLLADALRRDYTCVNQATKVVREYGWELTNRIKTLKVNTIYVEPGFFDIFGFYLEKGAAPVTPGTLVISHEAAQKFFNDADPVGQTLVHPTYGPLTIAGVLKSYKKQTQFRSDVMVSMATYLQFHPEAAQINSWKEKDAHTFVRLNAASQPVALSKAVDEIAAKTNGFLESQKCSNAFRLQQLNDISPSVEELRNNPYVDSMQDIYFNFSIPLMILLLAGFNYTNLTLARSLSRSKEVGVRKVMGAFRRQLVFQFIAEAVVIAFLALLVGLIVLYLMRQYVQVQWVTWEVDNTTNITLFFVFFTFLLGVFAGALPAWILSGFKAAQVLKGSLAPATFGKMGFRKGLIILQFVVTMVFVFMMGHLYNQFVYMATENESFNRKDIFNITLSNQNYRNLSDAVTTHKNVEKTGFTSMPFGGLTAECALGANRENEQIAAYYYAVDRNFIENMQLQFVAGENLPASNADSAGHFILINETAVAKLNLGAPQEVIGKTIRLNNESDLQVAGVLRDFCHFNYQFEKQPVLFQYNPAMFQVMSVKTTPNIQQAAFVADINNIWTAQYPLEPMVYSWYAKEIYERYYPAEDMKMMGIAGLVIFIIAIMGLLGMVIYTTEKRVREIGVRKVLGASVTEIVKILSWSFVKLLLIATAIALPAGYIAGRIVTSVFVYHDPVNLGLMSSSWSLITFIAVATIVFFAARAALTNPVKSLRSE